MSATEIRIAILVAAGVSLAVRALPLTLIRRQIRNRFIRSFLYYVPYVTLAAMTFPAMMDATDSPIAGAIAFIFAIILAWKGASLFVVSVLACIMVFVIELMPFIH